MNRIIRIVLVFIVTLIVTLIIAHLMNVKLVVAFAISLATFVVWWLLVSRKQRKQIREDEMFGLGLSSEEDKAIKNDLASGNRSSAVQHLQEAQERQRASLLEQGIDPFAVILVIGKDIKWTDIVRQVFRVLEFDRADTTVLADATVNSATRTEPYGYLLVESPILNVRVRLPITHRDDFALATTVYDEPKLAEPVTQQELELLVTYFPKHKLPMGFAGITHALHYVIAPRGTLERYYEFNNDEHMANPSPEKLFKRFAWEGEIRVAVNPDPEF
ncbi:MAG: hypothetical protein NTX52_06835 [Planctomycetota bacterium]|nr:hypothetical protein [Planctomycetota bacterium]